MTTLVELEAVVIEANRLRELAELEHQKVRGIVEERTEVEYRAGYFIPVKPIKGQFDVKRDRVLIEKGSHFFCQGHLGAVAIEKQGRNPSYCSDCAKIIEDGA